MAPNGHMGNAQTLTQLTDGQRSDRTENIYNLTARGGIFLVRHSAGRQLFHSPRVKRFIDPILAHTRYPGYFLKVFVTNFSSFLLVA